MMAFEIVPMSACHVPAIAAMERVCFSDPWSKQSVASELENPLSLWLVALQEGRLVGYIGSQAVLEQADVMNLAVAPDARRTGAGKALLQTLEARLRAQAITSLMLEVRPSNTAAVRLYAAQGFLQVGRRKNYYYAPTEDALILRKDWNL